LLLPVAALMVGRSGNVLGWAALALSVGAFAAWLLYYPSDWWPNPGVGGWMWAAFVMTLGWALLIAARWRRPPHGSS
jgi:hypothetical protein